MLWFNALCDAHISTENLFRNLFLHQESHTSLFLKKEGKKGEMRETFTEAEDCQVRKRQLGAARLYRH